MSRGAVSREAIIRTYLAEADQQLRELDEGLAALEARPDDTERVETMCRVAHTLKGTSAMLELTRVAEFAHALERVLRTAHDSTRPVGGALVSLLRSAVGALRRLVPDSVAGAEQLRPEHEALLRRLSAADRDPS